MKMISLLPEEAVTALKQELGETFNELKDIERLALVTAYSEGCVNHSRLKEVSKEHPHDITRSLHSLVEQELLWTEGSGRGMFYYLPGRHPMEDEMFGGKACSKSDFEHLAESSEHLDGLFVIAESVRTARRTPRERVISTILELCDGQYLTLEELSLLLNRHKDTLRTHYINPMLQNGQLEQKYKNITTHPNQKYRAVRGDRKE